jgi:pentose-5-phosphate-3-epimerase
LAHLPDRSTARLCNWEGRLEPRITISVNAEGSLEIFLNETGREKLIEELQKLDHRHDHFHLTVDGGAEVALRSKPYRGSDKIIAYGKVVFRPDDWDHEHYPHVFA